jgi:hypothetical protein
VYSLLISGVMVMGASDNYGAHTDGGLEELNGTQHRILRVLELTSRPLRSGELENALAIPSREGSASCRWLTDKGYITGSESTADPSAGKVMLWSLAEKGRTWVKAHG